MNMFAPAPIMSVGNTGQSVVNSGGMSTQTTGFGAIIEGLLATGTTLDAQSLISEMQNGTDGDQLANLLMQLFGGDQTDAAGTMLSMDLFGTQLDSETELSLDSNLQSLLLAMGSQGMTTQNQYTLPIEMQQTLLPTYSAQTNLLLADALSKMPTDAQLQMLQVIAEFAKTEGQASTVDMLTMQTMSGSGSDNSADSDVAKLIAMLQGQVTGQGETKAITNAQSFSDVLARMQMTGAVKADGETDAQTHETIDLNALQQNLFATAATGQSTSLPQQGDTTQLDRVMDIAKQLLQPMQNLTTAKNEFTVKLSPEGLGDITVKMVDAAGKLSLVLTASSYETARLLNAEMATLQSALRPFQPEAEPLIVVQTMQSENQNDYLSDGSTQQNQAGREQGHTTGYVDVDTVEELTSAEIIAQIQNSLLSERV